MFLNLFNKFDFNYRFFQGIPADNPSARHIYSVKDDSGISAISSEKSKVNTPKCLTCKLPEKIDSSCTYSDAIFSSRCVIFIPFFYKSYINIFSNVTSIFYHLINK